MKKRSRVTYGTWHKCSRPRFQRLWCLRRRLPAAGKGPALRAAVYVGWFSKHSGKPPASIRSKLSYAHAPHIPAHSSGLSRFLLNAQLHTQAEKLPGVAGLHNSVVHDQYKQRTATLLTRPYCPTFHINTESTKTRMHSFACSVIPLPSSSPVAVSFSLPVQLWHANPTWHISCKRTPPTVSS